MILGKHLALVSEPREGDRSRFSTNQRSLRSQRVMAAHQPCLRQKHGQKAEKKDVITTVLTVKLEWYLHISLCNTIPTLTPPRVRRESGSLNRPRNKHIFNLHTQKLQTQTLWANEIQMYPVNSLTYGAT